MDTKFEQRFQVTLFFCQIVVQRRHVASFHLVNLDRVGHHGRLFVLAGRVDLKALFVAGRHAHDVLDKGGVAKEFLGVQQEFGPLAVDQFVVALHAFQVGNHDVAFLRRPVGRFEQGVLVLDGFQGFVNLLVGHLDGRGIDAHLAVRAQVHRGLQRHGNVKNYRVQFDVSQRTWGKRDRFNLLSSFLVDLLGEGINRLRTQRLFAYPVTHHAIRRLAGRKPGMRRFLA